jgi:DNA-binding response OmpR family regulator
MSPSPAAASSARVLVAQRRLDNAGHLIGWLRQAGHDVDTTSTGADTLTRFAHWQPHAVILDSVFPDMDAVSLCSAIRERSGIPVLFLAREPDVGERLRAFNSGADDYLSLDIEPRELGARLVAALRRSTRSPGSETGLGERVLRVGPLQLDSSRHEVLRGDHALDLTPTEFAVLDILMANAGKVVARSAILDSIWGEEAAPSSNVVDRHIRTLRQKLDDGVHGRRSSQCIETVSRVGYRMRADIPEALAWSSAESS